MGICYNKYMKVSLTICRSYSECAAAATEYAAGLSASLDACTLVFSEEKITLWLERELCERLGGAFTTDVHSFRKYLSERGRKAARLSKQGSVMLVRKLINGLELPCFRRKSVHLAPALYELIAQLKSALVTPDDLEEASEGCGGILKNKLEDILAVYRAYEERLAEDGLSDQNSYLAELIPLIEGDERLKETDVVLVGYSAWTAQERRIVSALIRRAKSTAAFLVGGENDSVYTNEAARHFTALAREAGAELTAVTAPSGLHPAAARLAASLYLPSVFCGKGTRTDAVFCYEAATAEEEAEHAAEIIKREVERGARFRDFAIAAGDPAGDRQVIKRVFSAYGIPCFIDQKRALSEHALSRFLLGYLAVTRKNFDRAEALDFIRNPLFGEDPALIDGFENYLLRHNIRRGGLFYPFSRPAERLAEYERIRQKLMSLAAPRRETAAGFARAVRETAERFGAEETLRASALRLRAADEREEAAFTEQAYAKASAVLDEIASVMGEAPIRAEEFEEVLSSGFASQEISVIPQFFDAVYLGNFKDCKFKKTKYLFAFGMNGDVPFTKSDAAILNDSDLGKLQSFRVIVEPKIKAVNRRERENTCLALLSFSERLYLSYRLTDRGGRNVSRSELIDYILRIFDGLAVMTKEGVARVYEDGTESVKDGLDAMRFLDCEQGKRVFARDAGRFREGLLSDFSGASTFYACMAERGEKSALDEILERSNSELQILLGRGRSVLLPAETVSATALERYFTCPYRNFLEGGLKISERRSGEVKPLDAGNFLHAVLERYVGRVSALHTREESDAEVDRICADLEKEEAYAVFLEDGKGTVQLERLRAEAKRVAFAVRGQIVRSAFGEVQTEVSFGNRPSGTEGERSYPPLVLNGREKTYSMRGKVDRIDRAGDYIRVVDYKTGRVSKEDKYLYAGSKLQLYLYMNAFVGEHAKPAGVYYFPVTDRYTEDGEEPPYQLQGHTLDELHVLEKSDLSLSEGSQRSEILGISVLIDKKTGEVKPGKSRSLISERAFGAYLKYARLIAEQGIAELEAGSIVPSPFEDACAVCPYGGICGFEAGVNGEAREVNNVTSAVILAAAGEEEEDSASERGTETGD